MPVPYIVVVPQGLSEEATDAFVKDEIIKHGGDPNTAVLLDTDYPEEYGVEMNPDGTFPVMFKYSSIL